MADSLVYKLVADGLQAGVEVDRNRFREVYSSKYGKVRIFKVQSVSQESKEWVADPANRICDAPGSWFCRGQYPPALQKVLQGKKDFKQLEDFNSKDKEDDSEYQKEYFANLDTSRRAQKKPPTGGQPAKRELLVLPSEDIQGLNEKWENNESTTALWTLISENEYRELLRVLLENPALAHIRSGDGRGPMFWAYEYKRSEMIHALKSMGVRDDLRDAVGVTAADLFLSGM
jgi:dolichyl-diphosphooligosaccharide--protein glycosyltransferase